MTEQQMNSNPTYQQSSCTPCAACNESNTTTTRKRDENETKTIADDTARRVPQLRFPEFQNAGEWEPVTLKNIGKTYNGLSGKSGGDFGTGEPYVAYKQVFNGTTIKIEDCPLVAIKEGEKQNKLKKGDILVTISSETAQEIGMVNVITEDFKRSVYLNSFCFIFRPHNNCFIPSFAKYLFSSPSYRKQIISIAQGITRYNLSKDNFLKLTLFIPNLEEQQKIASCLLFIDNAISATTQKLEQFKAQKNALLQKLFPRRGETTPEIRFPEFQNGGKWETRNLGEVTTIVNKRNRSNRSLPIYSISNKDGFLLQTEQFDGLDSVKRGYDISMYKIVGKNTFAYNPARINVGSIGYSNNLKEVLISSLYVCFKTTEEVDDSFLKCYFDTLDFRQSVESNVEGGIRSYLFYENFSRIKIQLPSIQEQKQIASTLMSINALIEIVENKIALLEEHKKGLLQRLFPSLNK